MEGIHKRVGEVKKQDEAITIEILHAINNLLEADWRKYRSNNVIRKKVAEMGTWYIVGFCTGMRGEEMVLIELAGTRNSLEDLTEKNGSFKVVISGRTKGNQFSGSKFSFPCVNVTKGKN